MSSFEPKQHDEHKGWYCIPGYKSCLANAKGEIMTLKTGHVTKGGVAGRYRKVSVYPDGASDPRLEYVHILICKAFYGPPKAGQRVLHGNNNRKDNAKSNLKWGTQSDNIQQVYDDGLRPSKESLPLKW